MKIGDFCKKLDVSPTTVRFYINAGLLVPIKRNSQYHFTDIDIHEMQIIIKLKNLSFSIEETLMYLQVIRFYDIRDEQRKCRLLPIIEAKKSAIKNSVSRLNDILSALQYEIDSMKESTSSKYYSSGVPLNFSTYLSCPNCGKLFDLKNMEVSHNNIYNADLSCKCGYNAKIEDGIILVQPDSNYYTSDAFTVLHYGERPPEDQDFVFFQYMNGMSNETTSLLHKSYRWIDDKIKESHLIGKVIFIPDLASHFLYKYLDSPYFKDSTIIVSGFSKKTINSIKSHIDILGPHLDIIYIANTIYDLPIKKGLIDLWIDAISSYNFSFFHTYALQEKIYSYLSDQAKVVGFTKYYSHNSQSLKNIKRIYKSAIPNYSTLGTFRQIMRACHYELLFEEEIGSISNPGEYYDYHAENDYHRYHGFLAIKEEC